MTVFVTGGAGYIGSVVSEELVSSGHSVTAFDNLETGNRGAIPSGAEFVEGDIRDLSFLETSLRAKPYEAVVHLAALSSVEESVREPQRYHDTNVSGGMCLLEAIRSVGIPRMVFSSTASVYGEPNYIPIDEQHPTSPLNPYGKSKLRFESLLQEASEDYGLRYVALRYFNACGATKSFGEWRRSESHIIPMLLRTALGQLDSFRLYGTDYGTPDGTCIRDYVHVSDIASAHVAALEALDNQISSVFNVGGGSGFSNLEVIDAVKKVSGRDFEVRFERRRPGDPEILVASNDRIRTELGWSPRFTVIEDMVCTAWDWLIAHPTGYD